MLDVDVWWVLQQIFTTLRDARRAPMQGPRPQAEDEFGDIHILLFGDFKQLPPASSNPPFIVLSSVYSRFDFEELEQNRRVVQDPSRAPEIENFHNVLGDISRCTPTARVRAFLVQAYAAGGGITARN
eukprot:8996520-Karenia_brevis.AAC.1